MKAQRIFRLGRFLFMISNIFMMKYMFLFFICLSFPMRLQFSSSFLETCTSLNLLHNHYTALAIYTLGSACEATARRTILDHIINIWTFYSFQLDWNKREGCQRLSLSSVSTHNKVRPQHRELSSLGPVSRKSRELFGPEKLVVNPLVLKSWSFYMFLI